MLAVLFATMLTQAAAARPAAEAAKIDACALIANEEVRKVLGADVQERQPGTQQARGLLLSQCYLGTGTTRSVSIAVAGNTRSSGRTITPRAFWREQFHPGETQGMKKESREGKGKEEAETQARPISGVGDEAFWSGTRVAGALYVLRGDTFIRVSVGGIADEAERIEKSRRLAAAALVRLPR
jgi:hypothetical protein